MEQTSEQTTESQFLISPMISGIKSNASLSISRYAVSLSIGKNARLETIAYIFKVFCVEEEQFVGIQFMKASPSSRRLTLRFRYMTRF